MYGTECGATRRPRVPFPKNTSRKPLNPGGLKRKGGPKHKVEIGDQVEVTTFRACLQKVKLNSANLKN